MNNKIVLELDKNLLDNDILVYKDGKIIGLSIHSILPEYLKALEDISELKSKVDELTQLVRELRGEDDEESN